MVEIFTAEQFINALPKNSTNGNPLFLPVGAQFGELCWAWSLPPNRRLRILIRSSIDPTTGISASSGEDSIRIVMQRMHSIKGWISIQKKTAYTARIPGWEKRLVLKIKQVAEIWRKVSQDFDDDEVLMMCKQGKNAGRVFAKNNVNGRFRWLS